MYICYYPMAKKSYNGKKLNEFNAVVTQRAYKKHLIVRLFYAPDNAILFCNFRSR